jgi:F0F1-type ATP synthase assembly protein I
MDYAIQLMIPLFAGLFLGLWLTKNYGISPLWTVLFAIIGFFLGVGVMMKRLVFTKPPLKTKAYGKNALGPSEKIKNLSEEMPSENPSVEDSGLIKKE